ncbi:hypothetical protein PTT_12231 [Pyrenophora teres f. teres 0-1]|uniref:Uncharacterized protein n=2 Tax=Pyrenophora teres f. teres TaxID=97479 RepID=E3RTB3_PYRTT|nr:hypothetical protein PTT_12231 [Pyrenophora teres f. teres 0-1]
MENERLPQSEWLSGLNTAIPSNKQEPNTTPSSLMMADVAVVAAPTVTIKAEAIAINQASSTRVAVATSSTSLGGFGAKTDSNALPGVNQSKPELIGGIRENSDALPGVNQAKPELVNGVMPGKKQPFPTTITDGSASSLPTSGSPGTSSSPAVPEASTFSQPSAVPSTMSSEISVTLTPSSSIIISSVLSTAAPTITSSPDLSPQVVTFVTVTRTEEGKEYFSTESLAVPQTVNTPQMLSSSIPAPPAMETVLAVPAASDSFEPRRGLTPVSRALFILFGVLGILSMIIALVVFCIMRSNKKKRMQAFQQRTPNPFADDFKIDDNHGRATRASSEYGRNTQIASEYGGSIRASSEYSRPTRASSIYPPNRPVMTDSEKAIVDRAATPDGSQEASNKKPNARLTDAINTFLAKSRRLTYKITP